RRGALRGEGGEREHRQGAVEAEAPRARQGSSAGLEEGNRRAARGLRDRDLRRSGCMRAVAPCTSRTLAAAATRRIAASFVAPVPFRYERSLRPRAARVSPIQRTIRTGSDR